jgi:hypothetical protein
MRTIGETAGKLENEKGKRQEGKERRFFPITFRLFPRTSWPFALALSLLVHGCLVLSLGFISSRSGSSQNTDASPLDTRVTEINLVLCVPDGVASNDRRLGVPDSQSPAPLANLQGSQTGAAHRLAVPDKEVPASFPGRVEGGRERSDSNRTAGIVPRSPSGIPGTRDGTTTFFQIATQAKAIVYVIDRSASMGLNGGLAKAKRELLVSLDRLPSTCRFQIIAYNRSAEPLRLNGDSGLVFATPENKRRVAALLQEMEAEGSTEHLPALRRALALGPDVIFFLTDADDLRAEQIRSITSLNRGRTVIHTIGLGRPFPAAGDVPLYVLAQDNGGRCKSVPLGR